MRSYYAMLVGGLVLLLAGLAQAAPFVAADDLESYAAGSALNGQGGWSESTGSTYYTIAGGGGAGGTKGLSNSGGGSQQANWTAHPWDWGTLAVGDKAIARMDFQANGSGGFDDDRVGWVLASGAGSSSYHFGAQLDNADGGLVTYLRPYAGGNPKNILIPTATLAASGSNWYREELNVTKLTSALGPGGARMDVYFSALDAGGNVVGTPLTASTLLDTSLYNGFSGTVYPMYKNYGATAGNADNAYFEVTPEPCSMILFGLGGVALLRRRRR